MKMTILKVIQVEQKCSADCIYCRRNAHLGLNKEKYEKLCNPDDLNETFGKLKPRDPNDVLNEIKSTIEKYKGDVFFHITGTGEPFELPNFKDVLKVLRENKIKFSIETIGFYLHNKELLQELLESGLQRLIITFNSYRRERYNTIVGIDAYDQIIQALKNINELKPKYEVEIAFFIIINRYNIDHFFKIPFFIEKNFPNIKPSAYWIGRVYIKDPVCLFKQARVNWYKYASYVEKKILTLVEIKDNIDFMSRGGDFPLCFFPHLKIWYYQKYHKLTAAKFEDFENTTKIDVCKDCPLKEHCIGIEPALLKLYGKQRFIQHKYRFFQSKEYRILLNAANRIENKKINNF